MYSHNSNGSLLSALFMLCMMARSEGKRWRVRIEITLTGTYRLHSAVVFFDKKIFLLILWTCKCSNNEHLHTVSYFEVGLN